MAMSLSWQERVVRNTSALIVVLAAFTWADAQSLHSKKITFCCNSSDFVTIMEDLSKATGVHFVYSSNKIQTSQPITLSLRNKRLSEVLDLLGKQLNLSFKIQEHYITVKSNGVQYLSAPVELTSLKQELPQQQIESVSQEVEKTEKTFGPAVVEKMKSATDLPSNSEEVTPYVAKLKNYFDPAFLNKVPIRYLKSTAKKLGVDHGWFVSVGSLVNDYSAGVEVQAGLRHAYVVFTPTWLRDDEYHGALGLGTSLKLSNSFSLRPVYSYASMKETKTDYANTVFVKSPAYQISTATTHHQVKLMLQYDVSEKMKFRVGPTFNHSSTTSTYQATEVLYHRQAPSEYNAPPGGDGPGPRTVFRSNPSQLPASLKANKFWVGWEASFSYRINFK